MDLLADGGAASKGGDSGMPVNEHYAKWKVRYEGLHTLPLVLQPHDYQVVTTTNEGCVRVVAQVYPNETA